MDGRECTQCKQWKSADHFSWKLRGKRLTARCHECRKASYKENPGRARERAAEYHRENKPQVLARMRDRRRLAPSVTLVQSAKRRAKQYGLPFNITPDDAPVPSHCPALGIPLVVTDGKCSANSPSLDRIVPELGYVVGNVVVVSHRANTIKSDASLEEIAAVLKFYQGRAVTAAAES